MISIKNCNYGFNSDSVSQIFLESTLNHIYEARYDLVERDGEFSVYQINQAVIKPIALKTSAFSRSYERELSSISKTDQSSKKIDKYMVYEDRLSEPVVYDNQINRPVQVSKVNLPESRELIELENYLKYKVFDISKQNEYWKKIRSRIPGKDNSWAFYFIIDNQVMIFHFDDNPEFDAVYASVEQKFPALYSKYQLKVKKLVCKPSRVF
ncbi:MAG: hypothetical protein ACTSP4_14305 [Candidatus Hodarchaeales archaeon]